MKDAVLELRANVKPVLFFGVLGFLFVSTICFFFAYYILVQYVLDDPGSIDIMAALVLGFPGALWLCAAVSIWKDIRKARAIKYLIGNHGVTVLDEKTGDKKSYHLSEIACGSVNRVPFGRMIAIDRGVPRGERDLRIWGVRIGKGEYMMRSEAVDDCLYLTDDGQVQEVLSIMQAA